MNAILLFRAVRLNEFNDLVVGASLYTGSSPKARSHGNKKSKILMQFCLAWLQLHTEQKWNCNKSKSCKIFFRVQCEIANIHIATNSFNQSPKTHYLRGGETLENVKIIFQTVLKYFINWLEEYLFNPYYRWRFLVVNLIAW